MIQWQAEQVTAPSAGIQIDEKLIGQPQEYQRFSLKYWGSADVHCPFNLISFGN